MDRKKCEFVLNRCLHYQQQNEEMIDRLIKFKKIIIRTERDCQFLTEKLNSYNPNWENDDSPSEIKTKPAPDPNCVVIKTEIDTPWPNEIVPNIPAKKRTKKGDPNAPKKPANPYLQFCQEQRQYVTEDITQQDLSKIFAAKWKTLSVQDKQVYVDMFEKSKKKYNEQLDLYYSKH